VRHEDHLDEQDDLGVGLARGQETLGAGPQPRSAPPPPRETLALPYICRRACPDWRLRLVHLAEWKSGRRRKCAARSPHLDAEGAVARELDGVLAAHHVDHLCPGRKSLLWAVKRPARPHKNVIERNFTVENAKVD
jgi:hypothetical protein